jgi:hypothetical protein
MLTTAELPDAVKTLGRLADDLADAVKESEKTTDDLYDLITYLRTDDLVPVADMAEAMGRDRNYIDSTWSDSQAHGDSADPAWFGLTGDDSPETLLAKLAEISEAQLAAKERVTTLRNARNALVAQVYASRLMGPVAIAKEIGVKCNQVLRIVKKQGVAPVHRTKIRNQYSAK